MIRTCCRATIAGTYPNFTVRHSHCQRCGDAEERLNRNYHLHHRYGEENECYRDHHTVEFIREHYEVLCPECHAIHHGDSEIAGFGGVDVSVHLEELKRRANGALEVLKRRMDKAEYIKRKRGHSERGDVRRASTPKQMLIFSDSPKEDGVSKYDENRIRAILTKGEGKVFWGRGFYFTLIGDTFSISHKRGKSPESVESFVLRIVSEFGTFTKDKTSQPAFWVYRFIRSKRT